MEDPNPDFRAIILLNAQGLKDAIDTVRQAPDHWYTTLLIDLSAEFLVNCFELVDPNNGINVGRLAWAARNLLELHYFTRYVLDSEKKAKRFQENIAVDYRTLLERLAKNPLHQAQATSLRAVIDHLMDHHAQRITSRSPLLSSREIAEQFGEGSQYGDAHKFLSKFTHPTSMSIQFRKDTQIIQDIIVPAILETTISIITGTLPPLAGRLREIGTRT